MREQRLIEALYPGGELETATPGRRFGAWLLDGLLVFLTLGIGFLIWSLIAWQKGQTPAKQLLRVYVMREDGSRAGGWYMFLREALIKSVVVAVITVVTAGLFGGLAAAWCLWDKERQCLWDKFGGSYVAFSPEGYRPLTRAEYRERGQEPPGRRGKAAIAAV